jgi:hypothetical protein
MPLGELLTRWTVRVALTLYVLSLTHRLTVAGHRPRLDLARLFWTAGCLAFLLHTVAAFHFYHHWSHDDAYETTARQSAQVTGLDWGAGLYLNYAFAALWIADAGWWWLASDSYLIRQRALEWAMQGFLGFMAFNATVVFGAGAVRWFGLAASLFLAALLGICWCRRGDSPLKFKDPVEDAGKSARARS